MLVLTHRPDGGAEIGDDIFVRVLSVEIDATGARVRLGYSAPRELNIRRFRRGEHHAAIDNELPNESNARDGSQR